MRNRDEDGITKITVWARNSILFIGNLIVTGMYRIAIIILIVLTIIATGYKWLEDLFFGK